MTLSATFTRESILFLIKLRGLTYSIPIFVEKIEKWETQKGR